MCIEKFTNFLATHTYGIFWSKAFITLLPSCNFNFWIGKVPNQPSFCLDGFDSKRSRKVMISKFDTGYVGYVVQQTWAQFLYCKLQLVTKRTFFGKSKFTTGLELKLLWNSSYCLQKTFGEKHHWNRITCTKEGTCFLAFIGLDAASLLCVV